MITKEKREYARRPVDIPVEFVVQGPLYQGRIKNINKEGWIKNINNGGVFVETEMSFSVGQVISITSSSPQFGEKNRIGEIVWISPHGIGVKFKEP